MATNKPVNMYLLYHVQTDKVGKDVVKIIGVFSSIEKARKSLRDLVNEPPYNELPEGFEIGRRQLDFLCWAEGFVV